LSAAELPASSDAARFEAGDRICGWRAGDVAESDLVEEASGVKAAAVLAADPDL
jgi:hypothetical protein